MALIPRSFSELLDCIFIIPPYQRGYRWDEEQVTALLDDFKEFVLSCQMPGGAPGDSFYCLQPIVVVPAGDNDPGDPDDPSTPLRGRYAVIDGQQRLTTIYLLLNYLEQFRLAQYNIFLLLMPARKEQEDYLSEGVYKTESPAANDYIDNFYIRRAYETIEQWFKKPENQYQKGPFVRILTEPVQNYNQQNVRIIWYEITDMSAPEAFRRLNYGKIPLRSAELVKAVLLQSGGASESAPFRRAVEWDMMEHTLNDPKLWSMLVDADEDGGTRMELLLDFVADDLNREMKTVTPEGVEKLPFVRKPEPKLASDPDARDYFNYHVINEYIQRNAKNPHSREAAIEDVWTRIRDTFNLVTNWYDDRTWYHLIGLLRILRGKKGKKNRRAFVRDIYSKAYAGGLPVTKPSFTEELRSAVGAAIKVTEPVEKLNYHDHDKAIRNILTAVNVYVANGSTDTSARFSFGDFEKYNVTSLEHIHPQNITTDDGYDEFCRWFGNRLVAYASLSEQDWTDAVKNSVPGITDKDLPEKVAEMKREVEKACGNIKKGIADKATFKNDKEAIDRNVKIFDRLFEELSGISEGELHGIANLALVDGPTNSALQNFFLDRKRGILRDRETGGLTYVPAATAMVFSKEWSGDSPGDMRLWRKTDRTCYLNEILKAYVYFTSPAASK